MERKLREVLDEKERILWYGRPVKGSLLRSPDGPLQCLAWLFCAASIFLALFVFLPYALQARFHIGMILVVLVSAICLPPIVALRPVFDQKLLEHETVYAITDRRIIAIVKDDAMIIPRTRQTRFSINDRDEMTGCVCFDSAIGTSPYTRRTNAILGFRKPCGHTHGLIFFRVSQPDIVAQILACPA